MAQETAHVADEKRTEASQMRFLLQLARISVTGRIRNELVLQNREVDAIRQFVKLRQKKERIFVTGSTKSYSRAEEPVARVPKMTQGKFSFARGSHVCPNFIISSVWPFEIYCEEYECVCVCVCIYIYVYIYMYLCVYIYICVCVCVCVYTHTHTYPVA